MIISGNCLESISSSDCVFSHITRLSLDFDNLQSGSIVDIKDGMSAPLHLHSFFSMKLTLFATQSFWSMEISQLNITIAVQ
uniref:Uncharacterized protein n=1 Tax=Tetranychus urticae TaxID=32264 RepID=T1KV15_TETUR